MTAGGSLLVRAVAQNLMRAGDPTTTTLTFYAIVRAAGSYEVVSVMRSSRRGRSIERHVQAKLGIPLGQIEDELATATDGFTAIIEETSGHRLVWHRLGLTDVADREEQIRRIREWGRVEVS